MDINQPVNVVMNSISFSVWQDFESTRVSYLNENLKLNQSYNSIKDVDFLQINRLKERRATNLKCFCFDGKAKIRISVIRKPFYEFKLEDQKNGKGSKLEDFAFDVFHTLAETLNIK